MPLKLRIKNFLSKNKTIFNIFWWIYKNLIDLLNGKTIKTCYSYTKLFLFHRNDKNLISSMEDGLLRIRITEMCNAKCRFCNFHKWNKEYSMIDKDIIYKHLKPLYEQIKMILLTGGDPLITKESFNFVNFINTNYPKVTMLLETNGIAFDEKWQDLSIKNLNIVHFSLNSSNEDFFVKSCWEGETGRIAYRKVQKNLKDYIKKLSEQNLEVFTPDISMVVNKDNLDDVYNFVKYALINKTKMVTFYFDYTENNIESSSFSQPKKYRPVLKELMKIERVLSKKFFVYFRLWVPLKELELMQPEVEKIPIEQLRKEYTELLELAKNRDMKKEYENRQEIRKKHGKKTFSFKEDWTFSIQQINLNNKDICFAPFKELDIYPNGMIECCGWIQPPRINIKKWIKNDCVDWNKLFNSTRIKKVRYDMMNDDFTICQRCCPLNSDYNSICEPHKYGYDREKE